MALGLTDHPWSVGELIEIATKAKTLDEPQGKQIGTLRVIDGGLS